MKTPQERSDPLGRTANATLVFGVAGRIGSGASFVTNGLMEEIKAFGYKPIEIKITSLFLEDKENYGEIYRNNLDKSEPSTPTENDFRPDISAMSHRIQRLQAIGDKMREKYGTSFLSALSIKYIFKNMQDEDVINSGKRIAYVIDSLKHPAEVDLLRTVFKGSFFMIGVVADDSVRKRRLLDQKQINEFEFNKISSIDANESYEYGQHATNTILESDYFFENNYDNPDKINSECKRLLNLIFHSSIITPRQDEYGMHLAYMAADKSACLSRQVGSAIIAANGNVLATGCNDVPQFGGGLYTSESKIDNRCFAKSLLCHNDQEKIVIAEEIINCIKDAGIIEINEKQYEDIKKILLKKTRLRQLIEFSRAVHAEMDAIIAIGRSATPGIVGSTMYVTTYPCHNCAKHIIDSGIRRVVFIEPYVKSLAQKLHSDAINNPLEERSLNKVSFDNYGGVAPERYSYFFSIHGVRKEDSKMKRRSLEKDTLIPLGAQEKETLQWRIGEFTQWFNDKFAELPTTEVGQQTIDQS